MSCPTCSHTMTPLGYCNGGTWLYCQRCGTASHYDQISAMDGPPTVIVPKLVERCRDFKAEGLPREHSERWRKIGIAESINTPEKR